MHEGSRFYRHENCIRRLAKTGVFFLICLTVLCVHNASGLVQRTVSNDLELFEFTSDNFYISQSPQPLEAVLTELPASEAWVSFLSSSPIGYVYIDPRSGRPVSLTHVVPLLPGTGEGNSVTLEELSFHACRQIDEITEEVVREAALRFITEHADILQVDPAEFGEIRVINTDGDNLWDVFIRRTIKGVPVRQANVSLGINHGNVSLWGVEKWGNIRLDLQPKISSDQALEIGFGYIGGRADTDRLEQGPKLEILPVAPVWDGTIGSGYDHVLAWSFVFETLGAMNKWEVLVDAHRGTVIAFQDLNKYARKSISGTIYPYSPDSCGADGTAQTNVPIPYTNTGFASPNNYTTSGGLYDYSAGTATTTLDGKYINVTDRCGTISESSTTGDISLEGTHGDHDCDVPTGHSAGDTMAARLCAYEATHVNRMARGWVTYSWLENSLPCTVNVNNTCNALGGPSGIYFYTSGDGCSNTGELVSVIDHEWGHGLDASDVVPAFSNPAEGYADMVAIVRTQSSCIGRGFLVSLDGECGQWTCPASGLPSGSNCYGYGDCCLDCTGIRDQNYAKHSSGTPHTAANFVCPNCPAGGGPCGKSDHCEGHLVAETVWDLATRKLTGAPLFIDQQTAFEITTRLAFGGSASVTDWYSCTCPTTSSGCAANNGYMRWLNADDDDGNLNNGTPHMVPIHAAFNSHGIACGTPAPTTSGCSGGPTSAPILTATPEINGVSLSWTAVAGASNYYVFRTEGAKGCNYGRIKIATVSGTSWFDGDVGSERVNYYTVMAIGSSSACLGPLSNCVIAPCGAPQFSGVTQVSDVDGCDDSGIEINWTTPSDWGEGASSGTYTIRRYSDPDCSGASALVAWDLPPGQTSLTDLAPEPNTIYYYKVLAENNCSIPRTSDGDVPCSNAVLDHVGHTPVVNINNNAIDLNECNDTGVSITWNTNPTDWGDAGSGTRYYHVLRNGSVIATFLPYGTTSYIDTGGVNGTVYTYSVRYRNGCVLFTETTGAQAKDGIDTPPVVTANNTAEDINLCLNTGIGVNWDIDASDWHDSGYGTRYYHVVRNGSVLASFIPYGTTSYIDETTAAGVPYTYSVRYVNGCSMYDETTGVTVTDVVNSYPVVTTNNTATDVNGCEATGIVVNWELDADDWNDSGYGSRYYHLLRNGSILASFITYGTTSYTDTDVVSNTFYTYTVRYRNGCARYVETAGASAMDHIVDFPSGFPEGSALDISPCEDSGVLLTWDPDPDDWGDNGQGTRTYLIYRNGSQVASFLPEGTSSFIDTEGDNGVLYTYQISYRNGCNYSASTFPQGMDFVAEAPEIMTNNSAEDYNGCADEGVLITWEADPADWGDGGETEDRRYTVVRGGTPIQLDIPYGTTSYLDTTGTNSQNYLYQVYYISGCELSAGTTGVTMQDYVGTSPSGLSNNAAVDRNVCTSTGVQITWAQNPADWGDAGTGTRHYDVYRDATVIATDIPYGTNSFIDATGTVNVNYIYKVTYVNGCNFSTSTTGVTAMDHVASIPEGVTNNTAEDVNGCADTGVLLTWLADPQEWHDLGSGTRYYNIYRNGSVIANHLAYGTTNYTDTTGTNNVSYLYTVGYVSGCGYMGTTTGVSATDYVPAIPSGLTNNNAVDANVCLDSGVLITWAADPTEWNDNGFGNRKYDVYRASTVIAADVPYGTTSYLDPDGATGVSYLYRVQYKNGCSYVDMTTGVSAADTMASTPKGLPAITTTDLDECDDTGVSISWAVDPGDWGDNGSGGRYYYVYRGEIIIAGDIHYGTTQFTDTTGSDNVMYSYRVEYRNGCGLSADTDPAQAMDGVGASPAISTNNQSDDLDVCDDTGIVISWDQDPTVWGDNGYGTRTYSVYRDAARIATDLAYGTTQYTDTTGENGVNYLYRVQYVNGCRIASMTSGTTAMDYVSVTPSGLTNNTAGDLNACLDTGVLITWKQDVSDWGDNGYGDRFYHVYRGSTPIATNVPYGTTEYIDTTGTNGQSYLYRIMYKNGCNKVASTAGVSAMDYVSSSPSGLTNNTAVDYDPCLGNGISIAWEQDPADWGDNGHGTRTYYLWRNGSVIVADIPYGITGYIDATGTVGTSYHYMISYLNGCDMRVETTGADAVDDSDESPCPVVGNSLEIIKTDPDAQFTWSAVSCSDLAHYTVLAATSFSAAFPAEWTDIGNPLDPDFSIPLTSSYVAFTIITIDDCGNGSTP